MYTELYLWIIVLFCVIYLINGVFKELVIPKIVPYFAHWKYAARKIAVNGQLGLYAYRVISNYRTQSFQQQLLRFVLFTQKLPGQNRR